MRKFPTFRKIKEIRGNKLKNETHSESITHPSKTKQIVKLCQESTSLWDPISKSYPNGDRRAEAILNEVEEIRKLLVEDIKNRLTDNDCHHLRVGELGDQKLTSGRFYSWFWIDFLYEEDSNGDEIKYDKMGRLDNGAHVFRIWFTAEGVGIGVKPGLHKNHRTREKLINELPERYSDLKPLNSSKNHESDHDLHLKGINGRFNRYFATWEPLGFETDETFLEAVDSAWSEIGPVLNKHRC